MADEVLRRAARAITDLRKLAATLNGAGYPGSAIRLQGLAGLLKGLEGELVQAQSQLDAEREANSDEAKRAGQTGRLETRLSENDQRHPLAV